MNKVTQEVEIEIRGDEFRCRFGPISSAPCFIDGVVVNPPVPPLMIVLPQELADALAPGGDKTFGGVVSTATPDGFFRVDSASGAWVWELFPARWWDGLPQAMYVAVWRD